MLIKLKPAIPQAAATEPNPIGEVRTYNVCFEMGLYTAHSLTTQELDNGDVRITLDFTAPKGREISFQVMHDYDWTFFVDAQEELTTDGRQTYIWDVPKETLIRANCARVELYQPGEGQHDVLEISIWDENFNNP